MEAKPKIIKASMISSLLVLLPLALLAFTVIVGEALQIPGLISTNDTPVRAAGMVVLIVIPVLYPVLVAGMSLVGYFLHYFNKLSRKNLYIACGIFSILMGFGFGFPSPFGPKDQIIGLCIFTLLTLFSLLLGTFWGWKIVADEEKNQYYIKL